MLQSLTQIAKKLRTGGGASEVTTLWRYTNLFIIIIIFFLFIPQVVKIPGVKNYKS